VKNDLSSSYSAKTDDELLELFLDRRSLEPEAQSLLWDQIRLRRLKVPHYQTAPELDEVPFLQQNAAFNTPAKIGASIFILAFFVLLVELVFLPKYDTEWRKHFAYIFGGFLLVFGPIFAGIALVTRRMLKRIRDFKATRRHHSELL
jgi:hypothetical protein